MEPDNTAAEGTGVSFRALDENYKRLRYLVHSISIALLILTGVVFVFIYRQVVLINQQAEQLQAEVAEFQQSGAPEAIDELRHRLYIFSQENADFRPLFVRYFGTNPPAPAGAVVRPAGTNSPLP